MKRLAKKIDLSEAKLDQIAKKAVQVFEQRYRDKDNDFEDNATEALIDALETYFYEDYYLPIYANRTVANIQEAFFRPVLAKMKQLIVL